MTGINVLRAYLGKQEVRDRKELMNLFKSEAINNDIVVDPSKTPWCAAIVNACERKAGNPGTGRLNAKSFLKYGQEVADGDEKEGDIIVFERGSNSWEGHVAYFIGWDDSTNTVKHIGGNQSDAVTYSRTSQDRVVGIRRFI